MTRRWVKQHHKIAVWLGIAVAFFITAVLFTNAYLQIKNTSQITWGSLVPIISGTMLLLISSLSAFFSLLSSFAAKDTPVFTTPFAKDLQKKGFQLGEDQAADFQYIEKPIRDAYDHAIQTLRNLKVAAKASKASKSGLLIVGIANTGKTRLALEVVMKELPKWPVLCWYSSSRTTDIPQPETLHKKNLVIFIDDLQDFARFKREEAPSIEAATLRTLFEKVRTAAQRVAIVATCRTEDLENTQAKLGHLLEGLDLIRLPQFSSDEEDPDSSKVLTLFKEHGAPYLDQWDGTIGSILLGLQRKERQYLGLDDSPPAIILRAMKLLAFAGTMEYTEQRIRGVCGGVFGVQQLLEDQKVWRDAIDRLQQLQFIMEGPNRNQNGPTWVIKKTSYFDRVITNYLTPDREQQFSRDIPQLFETLVSIRDTEGLHNLGREFISLEQYEDALTAFNEALEINPNDPDIASDTGFVLVQLKRPNEALEMFEHVLMIAPNVHFVWISKGLVLHALKRDEEALASCDRALQIEPQSISGWMAKSFSLAGLRRFDEEIKALDMALTIDPNYALAWQYKGDALDNVKRYEEAIIAYDHALTLESKDASLWRLKALSLFRQEKYKEALQSINKCLSIDQSYVPGWLAKGGILGKLGKKEGALAAYHRAVDLDNELPAESNLLPTQKESDIEPPDDRSYEAIQNFAYFLMGINQVHNPKFGPTLELLSLIALHPVWKWIALAALRLELEEYEAALDALDHASDADPKDYISWLNKGNILNRLGRFDEALASFDHVLALSPEESEAWSGKGIALYNKGESTEALLALDHAASIHSEDQTIWAYQGFVFHDLKRYKEALQAFENPLINQTTDVGILLCKAVTLYKLRKYQEAQAVLDLAVTIDSSLLKDLQNKPFKSMVRNLKQKLAVQKIKTAS